MGLLELMIPPTIGYGIFESENTSTVVERPRCDGVVPGSILGRDFFSLPTGPGMEVVICG